MKRYGLIGYPLGHSFSQKYFTEKFIREGREDCSFELFPLASIADFPALLEDHKNLLGIAVTIPHKRSVIPFLTNLTTEAASIGAVNCIRRDGTITSGFNTDVVGFEHSFIPLLKPYHTQALVFGTGGASKAVQFILNKFNIPFLLVSRQPERAEGQVSYPDIDPQMMDSYKILINCSPAGMVPDEYSCPQIPYDAISREHLLYDLVYKPDPTVFLSEGMRRGAIVKNGYEMLILQAEENWKIWNGVALSGS